MKGLAPGWLTDGLLDFEYKKYVLLAYMQEVDGQFRQVCLYPPLADLVMHHQNLVRFKEDKATIERSFPQRLTGADFATMQLIYNPTVQGDPGMDTLEEIVDFALPQIEQRLQDGQTAYQHIEQQMTVSAIGLLPLHRDEGFMLMHTAKTSEIDVYSYRLTLFQSATDTYRGIAMQYVDTRPYNYFHTFEGIKRALAQQNTLMPNPATYLVESGLTLPKEQTLLPVAKRLLVRYILTNDLPAI